MRTVAEARFYLLTSITGQCELCVTAMDVLTDILVTTTRIVSSYN